MALPRKSSWPRPLNARYAPPTRGVEEPIAKSGEVEAWPDVPEMERLAHGVELPTPTNPAEVTVVVPVEPNAAVLANMLPAKRLVEVAACSEELPKTVRAPLALSAPPTLRTEEIVEEPVTASAVVVAPTAVSPPLNAISVVVAFEGNG